jgi:hypothetical protein
MRREKPNRLVLLTVALIWIMAAAGCSSVGSQSSPPPNPVGQQTQPAPTPTPTPAAASTPSSPHPVFYDFPDIPTPQELELQSKESYVIQSGTFRTGILTLRGRVDLNSLISFFQMAMPRESWKPKGYFRYQRSVLIFEKPDKTCVIRLYEGIVYTYVEIFVAPANG